MKRWNLTNRIASNIWQKLAKVIKEELESYINGLETELEGVSPSEIWNYDETKVRDDPGAKKVVMKRGTKYVEHVMDSSKVYYFLILMWQCRREHPSTVYSI